MEELQTQPKPPEIQTELPPIEVATLLKETGSTIRAGVLLLMLLFIFGSIYLARKSDKPSIPVPPEETIARTPSAFDTIEVKAASAFVYDLHDRKTLFEKNAKEVRPLASLTKIMTAVAAGELLPGDTTVTISDEDLGQEGNSGLYQDEKWRLSDLLRFTLLVSSNDGASAIANTLRKTNPYGESSTTDFIDLMNQTGTKLGLPTLHFANETGLDVTETESGGYGSAEDITSLFVYALRTYPSVFGATSQIKSTVVSESQLSHSVQNTNVALGNIPGVIASKTGYTNLAGGNLTVAFDAGINHPIIVTVLGSTYDGRFEDVEKLAAAALADLER